VPTSTQRTIRTAPEPQRRRVQIADAALRVLADAGSRGFTHRAVDEEAELPSGSSSNYFRTREALLGAAARRHADLDAPPEIDVEAVSAPRATLDQEQVRQLILAALFRVLDPAARPMLVARYELVLEAMRRPALQRVMDESRARFVGLAELLLRGGGCATPEGHARQLIALLDGITIDHVHATPFALDREGIEEQIDRFLATC
jgi:DNA-binding transcriptional regulator YbjK